MKIVETKVYQFDELSEDAKENAISELYDVNIDLYEWWDITFEDAKMVGLKITSFDSGRGNDIAGYFLTSPEYTAKQILERHGKDCDTYKTASEFLNEVKSVSFPDDLYKEDEFLRDILTDYLDLLKREYDYLTSKEAIVETIVANEYEFTEDGRLYY